jgi:hypothetical protein
MVLICMEESERGCYRRKDTAKHMSQFKRLGGMSECFGGVKIPSVNMKRRQLMLRRVRYEMAFLIFGGAFREMGSSTSHYPGGFQKDGKTLYLVDSRGRDKYALVAVDFTSGEVEVIAIPKKDSIEAVLVDSRTRKPQAISENCLIPEWSALDPRLQPGIDFLNRKAKGGVWNVINRTNDEKLWVVGLDHTTLPLTYYLYERDAKKLTKLFASRPELDSKQMAPMYGIEIKTRDGTKTRQGFIAGSPRLLTWKNSLL